MAVEEGFTTIGGSELWLRRWPAEQRDGEAARPPLVIVHGFGEHSGRYEELAGAVSARGREVFAIDLRGHGRSPGARAKITDLDQVLADVAEVVALAAASSPLGESGRSPVLYGHSMGGAFAAAFAAEQRAPLSGLVLSAPALHLALAPLRRRLLLRAARRLAPGLGIGAVDPSLLSRDPEEVAAYSADPLVWHAPVPACSAASMMEAGRRALAAATDVRVPVLGIHGADDQIVPVAASRALFSRLGAADATLVEYPGVRHEPHHELNRKECSAQLLGWLEEH